MARLAELRRHYHSKIGSQIVRFSDSGDEAHPNFADRSSRSSVLISNGVATTLGFRQRNAKSISGQRAGSLFERLTCEFIEKEFTSINHLRPGRWQYLTTQTQISGFVQYRHLDILDGLVS